MSRVTIYHSDGTVSTVDRFRVRMTPAGVWVEKTFYPMHTIRQIELDDNVIPEHIKGY